MLVPPLVFLGVFFINPLFDVLFRSVSGPEGLHLSNYRRLVEQPALLGVLRTTLVISLTVTACTLAVGYPLAYVMATCRNAVLRSVLLACVLIPFFSSVLVRTYAWMVVLSPEGVLNQVLGAVGIGPTTFLYNRAGVLIGMTYTLLPYMTLTIYSVMVGIDPRLMQAASNLGANGWQVFRRVYFPLSTAGVVGGSFLVLILSMGYFITPRLMGGERDEMAGMVIQRQVELGMDLEFAATLAAVLLALSLAGYYLYSRFVGIESLLGRAGR
jgi:putative spermidine/putrescine transport system permease protein